MLFYIHYQSTFDEELFKLWLNHYKRLDIEYKIYIESKDRVLFMNKYPYYYANYTIDSIPKNVPLELTEKDFLFGYGKDENDNMILNYQFQHSLLRETAMMIGRVFQVPVPSKSIFTTFEIPDFILYKHANHTNYIIDGLKVNSTNNNVVVSENIVCFTMSISKAAFEKEYYETNIIIENWKENNSYYFKNIYTDFLINVCVNKEKRYGFVWYPKCACTTITEIFCRLNGIILDNDVQKKRSLVFNIPNKYHLNNYLQNIDMISFYRNPYHRFISTYIDKHVYKTDYIYVTLDGYHKYLSIYKKDTIANLIDYFLQGGYISEHFTQIADSAIFNRYNNTFNNHCYCKMIHMNLGVNNHLYEFLKQYYDISLLMSLDILNCHENSSSNCKKTVDITSQEILNKENIYIEIEEKLDCTMLKNFEEKEWIHYLNTNKLDYEYILKDEEVKEKLTLLYQKDIQIYI
uniref:Sulfotransferase domain-containing protein n=1 Tax=viral metagenome TaxID=1070528 RepID=A0A6C0B144_9ZZZZ